LKTKEQILKIRYDDIYCFERQGKKIIIKTRQGSLEFLDSLKNIIEKLKEDNFLRCHHGFIVNTDKILEFKENLIIFDEINKKVPVSRRYRQEVLNVLSKNLFSD